MREPEIQPLIALIRSRGQVVHPLFLGHRIPFGRPRLVPPDVVDLGQDVETDIHDA